MSIRIGYGYDVHRLTEGRPFWLGGIEIPHDRGADGHSDADVLLHAICDALLGALALGDIGTHFPDTDPAYEGIASTVFLQKTMDLIRTHGYEVVNLDSTICLQAPKIAPRIPEMRRHIATVLAVDPSFVSVKATTEEGLGISGREEGVSATAVVLIRQIHAYTAPND
jgi:2-C-methyl-D-erythritol 2,4-cyclodiphosphate synthase